MMSAKSDSLHTANGLTARRMLALGAIALGLSLASSVTLGVEPRVPSSAEVIPAGTPNCKAPGMPCEDLSREPASFRPWWEEKACQPFAGQVSHVAYGHRTRNPRHTAILSSD